MRSPDVPPPQAIAPTSSPPTISSPPAVMSPSSNRATSNNNNTTTTTMTAGSNTSHDWTNTDFIDSMFNAAAEVNGIEDEEDGDGGNEENLHVCFLFIHEKAWNLSVNVFLLCKKEKFYKKKKGFNWKSVRNFSSDFLL